MNENDLAWVAGIMEGEGSIRINCPTKRNRGALIVSLTNTDEEMIDFFGKNWGGYTKRRVLPGNRKPAAWWVIASTQARDFLWQILPYIKTRRVQDKALLAIEFQAQKTSRPLVNRTAEYIDKQTEYFESMKVLNRRGK